MELLTALVILAGDWGAAASHMAYTTNRLLIPGGIWMEVSPKRLPFYERKIPIFGDVWHLIAGFRYIPMALLAWLSWGTQWEWYVGTALVNSLGWLALKALHGKLPAWGWKPRWMKSL